MSGGEHFVIPHHHYHYYHRILKRSCAERRKHYELLVRNRQRGWHRPGTLNLALNTAKRSWTARHTENVLLRVQDARETLQLASNYMVELGNRGEELARIDLSDHKVQEFINEFFPISEDLSDCQRKNNLRLQEDLKARYYNAPDLEWVGKNG